MGGVALSTVGAILVVVLVADAISTLVSTRLRVGRLWPAERFVGGLWWLWRRVASGIRSPRRREGLLAMFAPVSIAALLTLYVVGLTLGWALIWWGNSEHIAGVASFGDAVYFSGSTLFTIGFGDIRPDGSTVRLLAVLEALTGLGVTALVIGYLPTLYSAYSAREVQLLMLDDSSGSAISPADFIEAHTVDGDLTLLYQELRDWERWTARLLENHTSYPMLTLFRSQHRDQSWVSALAIVTDAAAMLLSSVEGARHREASLLYRRASRTMAVLMDRLRLVALPDEDPEGIFADNYGRIATFLPVVPQDQARADFLAARAEYGPELQALGRFTLAPAVFRSHDVGGPAAAELVEPHGHTRLRRWGGAPSRSAGRRAGAGATSRGRLPSP